jgi:hypothetical protein
MIPLILFLKDGPGGEMGDLKEEQDDNSDSFLGGSRYNDADIDDDDVIVDVAVVVGAV